MAFLGAILQPTSVSILPFLIPLLLPHPGSAQYTSALTCNANLGNATCLSNPTFKNDFADPYVNCLNGRCYWACNNPINPKGYTTHTCTGGTCGTQKCGPPPINSTIGCFFDPAVGSLTCQVTCDDGISWRPFDGVGCGAIARQTMTSTVGTATASSVTGTMSASMASGSVTARTAARTNVPALSASTGAPTSAPAPTATGTAASLEAGAVQSQAAVGGGGPMMNNLSTGAVIGLAVGAGVGVLLALAIAILVTRRNQRRARGSGRSKNADDAGSVGGSGRSLHSSGSRRDRRGIDDQPEASTLASRLKWPISISTAPKKEEAARYLNPSDNTSPPLIPFMLPTFLTASRRSPKSISTYPASTVSSFHRPPSTEPLAPRSPGGSDATSPIIGRSMPSPVPSDVSNPHSIPLSIAPTAATINRPYVAVFVYKAQRPDEFSVTVGDVLTVLEKYPDGWCTARKMDRDGTERLGVVPFGALKPLTSLDPDRDRRSSGLPHVPPKA